jgi:hypothetical protein
MSQIKGTDGRWYEQVIPIDQDGVFVGTSAPEFLTTGTISANGESVTLNINSVSSALITVSGTYNGTLSVTGKITDESTIEGGRKLFQSNVGSIGGNTIINDGTVNKATEYRIVAGGSQIVVKATAWTTGSVDIVIRGERASHLTFVNGPIHTALEEAQRQGRAFSVSTNVQPVTANNYFKSRFENPSGSGKRCFVVNRLFSNNRASGAVNLEAQLYVNDNQLATPTTVTPNNLHPGLNISSAVVFTWNASSTDLGGAAFSRILPVNGALDSIDITRIVDPGQSFTYQIRGAGNSIQNAVRTSVAMIWFEEDVN